MKNLAFLASVMFLSSCAWVVVNEETKNPDGSYTIRLGGNASARKADMINKTHEVATRLCGENNYTFKHQSGASSYYSAPVGGVMSSVSKPVMKAVITCKK